LRVEDQTSGGRVEIPAPEVEDRDRDDAGDDAGQDDAPVRTDDPADRVIELQRFAAPSGDQFIESDAAETASQSPLALSGREAA